MQIREDTADEDGDADAGGEREESPSPPPPQGDTIGDTAFSQRFVLKTFMTLLSALNPEEESTDPYSESFVEEELCILWDMTVERDVVLFLIRHDCLRILLSALAASPSPRVTEILAGMASNVCCFREGIRAIAASPEDVSPVLELARSDDARILIQVARFVFSCAYGDPERFDGWIDVLSRSDYGSAMTVALSDSINLDLLRQTFETLNCLCSIAESAAGTESLSKLCAGKNLSESTSVGLREIRDRGDPDGEATERIEFLFLSIHSTLCPVLIDSGDEQYSDGIGTMLRNVGDILERRLGGEDSEDLILYASKMFRVDSFPACDEVAFVFDIVASHFAKSLRETSAIDESPPEDVFLECIVRMMNVLDEKEFNSRLKNVNVDVARKLIAKCKNSSEYKKLCDRLSSSEIMREYLDDDFHEAQKGTG